MNREIKTVEGCAAQIMELVLRPGIMPLNARDQVERMLRDGPYKAMRALESLTPGGSEYVNDVDRCVDAAKHSRDVARNMAIRFKKRLDLLELENENLKRELSHLKGLREATCAAFDILRDWLQDEHDSADTDKALTAGGFPPESVFTPDVMIVLPTTSGESDPQEGQ